MKLSVFAKYKWSVFLDASKDVFSLLFEAKKKKKKSISLTVLSESVSPWCVGGAFSFIKQSI